jgi:hypothetical protein
VTIGLGTLTKRIEPTVVNRDQATRWDRDPRLGPVAKPMTVRYYAHVHAAGPVRYGQVPGAIGVLEAPDHPMPIGIAFEADWTDGGLAVGRLTVSGADDPG